MQLEVGDYVQLDWDGLADKLLEVYTVTDQQIEVDHRGQLINFSKCYIVAAYKKIRDMA